MARIKIIEKKTGIEEEEFYKCYYKYFKGYIVIFSMNTGGKMASYPSKKFKLEVVKKDASYGKRLVYVDVKCNSCGKSPMLIVSNLFKNKLGNLMAYCVCNNCNREYEIVFNLGTIQVKK